MEEGHGLLFFVLGFVCCWSRYSKSLEASLLSAINIELI